MSRCDLYLENYDSHYTGGQTIVGHVLVTLDKDKDVCGIYVDIKGEVKTHWVESNSEYHHHEDIFSHQIQLINNDLGTTRISLGVHKYPFTYILPANLPSSFKGSMGKIEYIIKAVVDRPFLKSNFEAESVLSIYTPINLSTNSMLREPRSDMEKTNLYFCCWSRGSMNLKVDVPFTGIAIGQPLPIRITVENLARVIVDEIKCTVTKTVKYTATKPSSKTRFDSAKIFVDRYSGVGAHGVNTYDKTILIRDSMIVPNLGTSEIIQANYVLKVELVLPFPHINPSVMLPVTLGNIPISGSAGMGEVVQQKQPQLAAYHDHVSAPEMFPQSGSYNNMGGPSCPMPSASGGEASTPPKDIEAMGSHHNQGYDAVLGSNIKTR